MSIPAFYATSDDIRCRYSSVSCFSPRHQKRFEPLRRRFQFVLLNGPGGIDLLGTDLRAFADESASPYSFVLRENIEPFFRALIARIHVVALRESDCCRPDKMRV